MVTIVPHRELFLVPFPALMDSNQKYLIEKHALATAPAAGVLQFTGQKRGMVISRDKPHLLSVGDPLYPANSGLLKLRGARAEANAIAELFAEEHKNILLDGNASESEIKRKAPAFTILHFATHGLLNERQPMLSALALAADSLDDGFLTCAEIFALPQLHADLVVLSACQTGRGEITGDGILGLSRAFLYEGRNVWAVAFGAGLNVAFGNSNTPVSLIDLPLEKSFNFADFSLSHQTPLESAFRRTQTEYGSKRLEKVSDLELRITGGGTIKNDKNTDLRISSYTFTKDGDVVVGSSFSLKLYRNDGTFIRKFVGHTGEVWAVSVSQDGRLLASASYDQTIKLWNIASGELLATLFVAIDNEWVCWTPAGYYAASAGGEKYIGWHLNQGMDKAALYYPVSTFRQQYYKPEVVQRTIALGNFAQALAEINAQERQKIAVQAVTEVLPPKVQWLSPSAFRSENSSNMVQLKAKLTSDTKITEVRWLQNGRPFSTKRAEDFASTTSPALGQIIEQEATLNEGENEFSIFAANANASATSEKRIMYKPSAQRGAKPVAATVINDWEKPNLYMVSVGISAYQLSALSLNYADDDARAMSRIFQAQQGKLYRTVNIKPLYDLEATRANILDALDWLEKSATQKDVAIIFLAAHGVNDNKGNFYVLPSDGNPDKLRVTCIDLGDFKKTLGDLPSRVLLFLDTCHSGRLGANLYTLRGVDNTEALRELASDEFGVVIMAASTGKEGSQERPEWGHGAFTKAVLEGLQNGADYDEKDGIVHLHELDYFVTNRVKELTGGKQHPTTQKPSTISRFPIFQLR